MTRCKQNSDLHSNFLGHVVLPACSTHSPPLAKTKNTISPGENVSDMDNLVLCATVNV